MSLEKQSRLGVGVAGRVYRVKSPNNEYALKVNLKFKGHDMTSSYRELQCHVALKHPFIVEIASAYIGEPFADNLKSPINPNIAYVYDNLHFMYKVAKCNMFQLISDNGVTADNFLRFSVEIILALEYIHAKGYIHRDIKSDNILLMEEDGVLHCKICDFGFSKMFLTYDVHTPEIGTMEYVAPECALGYVDYGVSSDVWSLGCVLFEMFTQDQPTGNLGSDPEYDDLIRVLQKIHPDTNKSRTVESFFKRKNVIRFSASKGLAVKTMIFGFLRYQPKDRTSIRDALELPIFSEHRDLIDQTRLSHPLIKTDVQPFEVHMCNEREIGMNFVFRSLKFWKSQNWFTFKILFQAMDNFDRFLVAIRDSLSDASYVRNMSLEEKTHRTIAVVLCNLYVVIKCSCTVTGDIHALIDIIPKSHRIEEITDFIDQELENSIVDHCLGCEVFTMTCYNHLLDIRTEIDSSTITELLNIVRSGRHHGHTPATLCKELL